MSGHSKWANIKRRKESVDNQRANVFAKLGKEIVVAVKSGGPDPVVNGRLKDIIAKCKANNMPNDNITRCIQKASGAGSDAQYEEITYEGFGPGGVAVIVEAMTDNKNRAAADIRCIFDKSGGSMGQSGSVGYMFNKKGVIVIELSSSINEDDLMMQALEAGAEDFAVEDEYYEIITEVPSFSSVRETLENLGYNFIEAEIKMIPTIYTQLDEATTIKFQNMLDKLENNDDVQNVWHNAE